MKGALATFVFLACSGAVVAQSTCPPPGLRVLANNQEVPGTGAAFADKLTLLLSPGPACADKATYQIRGAEIILIRGRMPLLPPRRVRPPEVDLSDWKGIVRSGDRINIFIPYSQLVVVSVDGKQRPFIRSRANTAQQKETGTNQTLYEADGIRFVWQLIRK